MLIHGNVSSSLFYQPLMLGLPEGIRALAIDLRGFGDSETLPVDGTRGLRDFADDVASVLDALGTGAVHLVGWSMGGGVVQQVLLDRPDLVASLTLESPVSPYGFGGTTADGTILNGGAGAGGGGGNPTSSRALAAGDRSDFPHLAEDHLPDHLREASRVDRARGPLGGVDASRRSPASTTTRATRRRPTPGPASPLGLAVC